MEVVVEKEKISLGKCDGIPSKTDSNMRFKTIDLESLNSTILVN